MTGYDYNTAARNLGVSVKDIQRLDASVDDDGEVGELSDSIFDEAKDTLLAIRMQRDSKQNWAQTLAEYAEEYGQNLINWALEVSGISQNSESKKMSRSEKAKQQKDEENVKKEMQAKVDTIKNIIETTGELGNIKIKGIPNGTTINGIDITPDFSDSSNDELVIEDETAQVIKKADALIITLSYTYNGKSQKVESRITDRNFLEDNFEGGADGDVNLTVGGMPIDE